MDSELLVTESDMKTEHFGPFNPDEDFYVVHRIVDKKLRSKFYLRLVTA